VFFWFLEGSSSNQKANSEGWISSSSSARGLGESSDESWDVEIIGSGLVVERLSWLDIHSLCRGSDSAMKEVFSEIRSKNHIASSGVLSQKNIGAVMSRY
jgi:hypothetical protein